MTTCVQFLLSFGKNKTKRRPPRNLCRGREKRDALSLRLLTRSLTTFPLYTSKRELKRKRRERERRRTLLRNHHHHRREFSNDNNNKMQKKKTTKTAELLFKNKMEVNEKKFHFFLRNSYKDDMRLYAS